MAEQLILPFEVAQELAYCHPCENLENEDGSLGSGDTEIVAVVENRHTGEQRRWASIHELVLRSADGRLWYRLYEKGLTESQDTSPFDDEGESIPFDEVRRQAATIFEYVPIGTHGGMWR